MLKEHKKLETVACFKVSLFILLMCISIYFSPEFVANNYSPDGILEQPTIFKINFIRICFIIFSTVGLLISINKPNIFHLLRLKIFGKQNATTFLMLLLFVDFTFIVIHFIIPYTSYIPYKLFHLEIDHGYPEMYQYIKWLWIIILLIYVSKKSRSFGYATWALFFTYLLFDDAWQIHERVGYYFSANIDMAPPFGLRIADIGELYVTATVGIILLFPVTWAYLNGKQAFKKASQHLVLLILALVFFGVGVDMAHIAIKLGRNVSFLLGVIEDGGEMLIGSLILWYVYLLSKREEITRSYTPDYIRIFMNNSMKTAHLSATPQNGL